MTDQVSPQVDPEAKSRANKAVAIYGLDRLLLFIALTVVILYAAYLHARATAGWKSSAAAWINVFALCMTIFNMTYVNTVIAGLHSYAGLN